MIIKTNILLFIILTICGMSLNAYAAKVALTTKNSSSSLAAMRKNTATTVSASIRADSEVSNEDDDAADDVADDDDDDAAIDNNDDADGDDEDDANDGIAAVVNAAIDNELKSDVQAGNDVSSVSVWSAMRGLWNWFKDEVKDSIFGEDNAVEGRTFGKIRRLQMALIPLMFKFGILTAMIAFLVLLGMKTIFLLKVLLLLNVVAILGKFLTLKSSLFGHVQQQYSAPTWNYAGGWSTAPAGHGDEHHHQHPSKEIHLHIHGAQAQPHVAAQSYSTYGSGPAQQHWERRSDPYAAYDPASQGETAVLENQLNNELNGELNIAEPLSFLPTKYPTNHRQY